MIVNELVTKFNFKLGNGFQVMNQKLKQTVTNTNRATTQMGGSFQRLGQSLKRALTAKISIGGIFKARGDIESVKKQADALGKRLKMGLTIAGGAALGAAGIVGAKGMQALGEYQSGLMRLQIQYGDTAKAAKVYNDLVKFAAKTPFELPEVVSAFTQLKAQGFDLDYSGLTALGDLASASNKSLEELTNGILSAKRGHADMVDNFLGLSAKVKNGKMIASMTMPDGKDVVKSFDTSDKKQLLDFFIQAGKRKNVLGMMDAQSKTIPGQLSTMADETKMLLVAGFKPLESSIAKAFGYLSKFTKEMKPLAIETGLFIKHNLPGVLNAIGFGFKVLKNVMPFIVGGLYMMTVHWGVLKTMTVIDWLGKAAMGIRAVGFWQWFLNGAVAFLPTLIIGAGIAIAAFFLDTFNYFKTGKSVLLDFTAQWPWLQKGIKAVMDFSITFFGALYDGFKKGIDFWMPKLTNAFYYWKSVISDVWAFLQPKFEALMGWIKTIADAAGKAFGAVSSLFNSGGNTGGTSVPFVGSEEGILGAAEKFAAGAPGQSMADKWAKDPNAKVKGGGNYWHSVKQLYIKGVACDISTEKVVELAGADQAVLNAMVGQVDATMKNLLRQGLAEVVPRSQLRGGELFYEWSNKYNQFGHTGIVGEGGRSLYHASNNSGSQIGMGQRFTRTQNYLSDRAMFLRIKPEHMRGNNVILNQTFNGPADPNSVGAASQKGANRALATQQPRRGKRP